MNELENFNIIKIKKYDLTIFFNLGPLLSSTAWVCVDHSELYFLTVLIYLSRFLNKNIILCLQRTRMIFFVCFLGLILFIVKINLKV